MNLKVLVCLIISILLISLSQSQSPCGYGCKTCGLYGFFLFCIQCHPNRTVNATTGLCDCNAGFYQFNQICYTCPSQCNQCALKQFNSNSTYCKSCPTNSHRILNSSSCVCQSGYVESQQNLCQVQVKLEQSSSTVKFIASIAGSIGSFIICVVIIACMCYIRKRNGHQIHERNSRRRNENQMQQSSAQQNIYNIQHIQHSQAQQSQMPIEKQKILQYKPNEICSICLDVKTSVMTECGHYFHPKCIKSWFKKSKNCPNCNLLTRKNKLLKWCKKCYRDTILASDPSQFCEGCQNCQDVMIIN